MIVIDFSFPALFHDFKAIGFYLDEPPARQFVLADIIRFRLRFSIRQAHFVASRSITIFHRPVRGFYYFTEYFRSRLKRILRLLQGIFDFRRLHFMLDA